MSAGGFICASETATYDSSVFTTKMLWAQHLFLKQIYAFLKASKMSANAHEEEHQYWDFDTSTVTVGSEEVSRLDGGSYSISNDILNAHTVQEWNSVSEVLSNNGSETSKFIHSVTSSDSKPGLVCYFTGRGGEHLAFTNYSDTTGVSGSPRQYWATSIINYSQTQRNLPCGFGIVLSPYHNFNGNIISSSSDDGSCYPDDCLSPIGWKMATYSGSGSHSTIIDDAANGGSYTFYFAVKFSQVIAIVTSPVLDATNANKYMLLVFGDIIKQTQEGDSYTYGAGCGYSRDESECGAVGSAYYQPSIHSFTALSSYGTRLCQYVSSDNASTHGESQCAFVVGHSSNLSDGIPYTVNILGYYQDASGQIQLDNLVKDGNGYKGIIDPDMIRYIPNTVPVGTLDNGNFIVPRKTATRGGHNMCIGWDPSNPSTI